jgi:hypothetical protein
MKKAMLRRNFWWHAFIILIHISSVSGPYSAIDPYVKPFFTPQFISVVFNCISNWPQDIIIFIMKLQIYMPNYGTWRINIYTAVQTKAIPKGQEYPKNILWSIRNTVENDRDKLRSEKWFNIGVNTLHWRLPLLYIAGLSTQVFLARIFNIITNRHINNKRIIMYTSILVLGLEFNMTHYGERFPFCLSYNLINRYDRCQYK